MPEDLYDDKSFLFKLPLFTYLIEPGPNLGFLRGGDHGIVYLPVWTDLHLFEDFLEKSGLAGKVSGLTIHSEEEFVTCLKARPAEVTTLVVDPPTGANPILSTFEITKLLRQLDK